uniref:PDGLE domain-containing protein n=1 Tax=Ammonifex degensii TaxID=42838 RepID=A0A7C2E2H0_9THEO
MRKEIWIGLIVALIIAGLLSPFASPNPDGLEKVAETKGFIDKGEGKEVIHSPIPDYVIPGLAGKGVATAVAGIIGTLITFAAACAVSSIVKRSRNAARGKG